MPRPRIHWDDRALRLIMSAIERYDRQFPQDNARFLDALIDEVRVVTGRLYGTGTYARLLRDAGEVLGVTRRPSNTTIQKAIERAQRMAPSARGHDEDPGSASLGLHALRRALEPLLHDSIAPVLELLGRPPAPAGPDTSVAGAALELELAHATLDDARRRMRALEDENARLRREAGAADMRAAMAETRLAAILEEIHRAIRESAGGASALARAAQRLEGTEQYLKRQHDAVRQQALGEVDGLRAQNKQLRDQIGHLQIENDQYRRALTAQRAAKPDER